MTYSYGSFFSLSIRAALSSEGGFSPLLFLEISGMLFLKKDDMFKYKKENDRQSKRKTDFNIE